jgi:hypothetical protein
MTESRYIDPEAEAFNEIERRSKVKQTLVKAQLDKLESQEPVAHWSDCAVHSEPAYPKGECNCGGFNPVAWLVEDVDGAHLYWTYKQPIGKEKWTPLFSSPSQRTWVGLTDSQRKEIERQSVYVDGAIRMTEAKLKENNT